MAEALITPQRSAAKAPDHARRFRIVYGVLAAIAVFGVFGAFVVHGSKTAVQAGSAAWAAFQPSGASPFAARQQIAAFVSQHYVGDDGQPFVAAVATHPVQAAQDASLVPLEFLAIQHTTVEGAQSPTTEYLDGGVALAAYQLCGVSGACALTGTPSAERERLLRREALELALYTFGYLSNYQTTIVYLPQGQGDAPRLLLFRRADLAPHLARPLADTLSDTVFSPTALAASPEAAVVDSLTANSRYSFRIQATASGNAALVLQAIVPSGTT